MRMCTVYVYSVGGSGTEHKEKHSAYVHCICLQCGSGRRRQSAGISLGQDLHGKQAARVEGRIHQSALIQPSPAQPSPPKVPARAPLLKHHANVPPFVLWEQQESRLRPQPLHPPHPTPSPPSGTVMSNTAAFSSVAEKASAGLLSPANASLCAAPACFAARRAAFRASCAARAAARASAVEAAAEAADPPPSVVAPDRAALPVAVAAADGGDAEDEDEAAASLLVTEPTGKSARCREAHRDGRALPSGPEAAAAVDVVGAELGPGREPALLAYVRELQHDAKPPPANAGGLEESFAGEDGLMAPAKVVALAA